jgi:hypothetical protein
VEGRRDGSKETLPDKGRVMSTWILDSIIDNPDTLRGFFDVKITQSHFFHPLARPKKQSLNQATFTAACYERKSVEMN